MPVSIPMSNGLAALVDEADVALIAGRHLTAFSSDRTQYARITVSQRLIMLSRFLLQPPPGFFVDHKDHDGLNNQRSNLRLCTPAQNSQNQKLVKPRGGAVQFKGVYQTGRTIFTARITCAGVSHNVGKFATAEEAARAYDAAALRLHGEFAWLNFQPVGAAA